MFIHFMAGLIILVLGAAHFASLTFLEVRSYGQALIYGSVLMVYKGWAVALEIFLLFVTFHTFNGFRKILLELKQGSRYERTISMAMLSIGLVVFIYGTRTILLALMAT